MSRSAPAIPLFGDAYLADTRHLSLEEHGAYLQLMMIAWRTDGCCLPDDDKRLSQMLSISAARWSKLKPVVMAFWQLENGVWSQRRLSKERQFVEEKRSKNKLSAQARWNGQVIENIEDGECERTSERNAPPPPPNIVDRDNTDSIGVLTRETRKKTKPKMIPIPTDWTPDPFGPSTKSAKIVDGWPPGEIETQLEKFEAHHRKTGSQWVDWQAAWRTWVLKKQEFDEKRKVNGTNANGNYGNQSRPARQLDGFAAVCREVAGRSTSSDGDFDFGGMSGTASMGAQPAADTIRDARRVR